MPAFQGSSSPHRWNQIRKLPMQPEISSLRLYEDAVSVGQLDALTLLRNIDPLQGIGIEDLRVVHHLIFHRVHPWAGQFRAPGQVATVSGYPSADPYRIARELELAVYQFRELLGPALVSSSSHEILRALSFFHVRFERIHPFLDGNGRTGRVILAVQMEKLFGRLPTFGNQSGYRAAIRESGSNDLVPFIRFLSSEIELPSEPGPVPSPFRLAPRFLETEISPPFEQDLAWSRV